MRLGPLGVPKVEDSARSPAFDPEAPLAGAAAPAMRDPLPSGAAGSGNPSSTQPMAPATTPAKVLTDDCRPGSMNLAGCPCGQAGQSLPCWTGSAGDRNRGDCRDGAQTCVANGVEFATWSACEGEQHACGAAPPPPAPPAPPPPPSDDAECKCIPGSVIHCDDDCSINLFCVASALKTCLPDGTWSVCREAGAMPASLTPIVLVPDGGMLPSMEELQRLVDEKLALSQMECWSRYNGCQGALMSPLSIGETFSGGGCPKVFTCGRAPDPVPSSQAWP